VRGRVTPGRYYRLFTIDRYACPFEGAAAAIGDGDIGSA
jgi:hypothetical protein